MPMESILTNMVAGTRISIAQTLPISTGDIKSQPTIVLTTRRTMIKRTITRQVTSTPTIIKTTGITIPKISTITMKIEIRTNTSIKDKEIKHITSTDIDIEIMISL